MFDQKTIFERDHRGRPAAGFRRFAAAYLAILFVSHVSAASNVTVDENDKLASAAAFHRNLRTDTLDSILGTHPDGAKGYTITPRLEGGVVAAAGDRVSLLTNKACLKQVFGIYELEAVKSFAGKDDVGIFTKLRFKLIDDWRSGAQHDGKQALLVMQGGEIERKGETLRVVNPLLRYVVGGTYLLVAGDRKYVNWNVIYAYAPFIEVRNGRIYPAPVDPLFPLGTSVARAKAEVRAALQKRACE